MASKHKAFKQAMKSNPHFAKHNKQAEKDHILDMNTRELEVMSGLRPPSAKEQAMEAEMRKACPELFYLLDKIRSDEWI